MISFDAMCCPQLTAMRNSAETDPVSTPQLDISDILFIDERQGPRARRTSRSRSGAPPRRAAKLTDTTRVGASRAHRGNYLARGPPVNTAPRGFG
jgi:hypothetical protein